MYKPKYKKNIKLFMHTLVIAIIVVGLFVVLFNLKGNKINKTIEHKKKYIVLIHSGLIEDNIYWGPLSKFAKTVAKSLEIDFDVFPALENQVRMTYILHKVINGSRKPDAIIIHNYKNMLTYWLTLTNNAEIPTFVITESFLDNKRKLGLIPRKKYKYWIGEMKPNDYKVGYELAQRLAQKAHPDNQNKIKMLAFEGVQSDIASIERIRGLKKAVKENKNLLLLEIITAKWKQDIAKQQFIIAKEFKHQDISAVWAANDIMAVGIIEGAERLKIKLGKELIVGGVDWSPEAIPKIRNGELYTSAGGHIFEGGWAVIKLYDYLNGIDFIQEGLITDTPMHFITKENLNNYEKILNTKNWSKIDYKNLSKAYNPKLKKYKFSVGELLKELQKQAIKNTPK